jgi:hypothetical protein
MQTEGVWGLAEIFVFSLLQKLECLYRPRVRSSALLEEATKTVDIRYAAIHATHSSERTAARFSDSFLAQIVWRGTISNHLRKYITTVRIGVINTALLGCKTHSKRTAINTATGGEFTPQKK